jgi:hypothetical protein
MTRIKFEYPADSPTTTIELTWGLEMNAPTWRVIAGSVQKRAFDGTIHAAVKRVSERQIPLVLNVLTESERDSLIDFIIDVVEGRYRVFRYTDQDSEEHDVRFLDEEFDFGDGTVPYALPVTLVKV